MLRGDPRALRDERVKGRRREVRMSGGQETKIKEEGGWKEEVGRQKVGGQRGLRGEEE